MTTDTEARLRDAVLAEIYDVEPVLEPLDRLIAYVRAEARVAAANDWLCVCDACVRDGVDVRIAAAEAELDALKEAK